MSQTRKLAGLCLCLAALALIAFVPSGLAAKPKLETGTYIAKVSGGGGFKFKVTGYIPDKCGTHAGTYCLVAVTYPKVKEPCTSGQAEDNDFAIPDGYFKPNGRFSYFQKLDGGQQPLISFMGDFSGSKVTGTLREEDLVDEGTGTLITCDTGTVHWTAKRL